ncbi:hypothetical protein FB451DRAFT_1213384 [Mycena latifolia]|nr:hypothetical protein FB451DRAFT_1213384 [Mycena latifolia]
MHARMDKLRYVFLLFLCVLNALLLPLYPSPSALGRLRSVSLIQAISPALALVRCLALTRKNH